MAECVCMLNAPESHKPLQIGIKASVESLRQMTQAMFVHVEESAVLGMLHDATDGAYGEAAEAPPAISARTLSMSMVLRSPLAMILPRLRKAKRSPTSLACKSLCVMKTMANSLLHERLTDHRRKQKPPCSCQVERAITSLRCSLLSGASLPASANFFRRTL